MHPCVFIISSIAAPSLKPKSKTKPALEESDDEALERVAASMNIDMDETEGKL